MPHWQPAVIFLNCLLCLITANKFFSFSLSLSGVLENFQAITQQITLFKLTQTTMHLL